MRSTFALPLLLASSAAFAQGAPPEGAAPPSAANSATASGGVWKSVNNGTTFKPVFDKQNVQSIGRQVGRMLDAVVPGVERGAVRRAVGDRAQEVVQGERHHPVARRG